MKNKPEDQIDYLSSRASKKADKWIYYTSMHVDSWYNEQSNNKYWAFITFVNTYVYYDSSVKQNTV
jgi:hypothetical protein